MNIAWENVNVWLSLAGGALIGLAAAMFILLNGRIGGISGMLASILSRTHGDTGWRYLFLAGLMTAPWVYAAVAEPVKAKVDAGPLELVIAGLLVGLGTRYASGCTSGHGVCGIARGSLRSLAATASFMVAGFSTVFLLRHLGGG